MTARGPRAWSLEPFSAFRPVSPWSSPARLIASGLGLPYNILSGDLSDTSYSSARVGLSCLSRRFPSQSASILVHPWPFSPLPVNDHAPVISFLSSIINNVAKPCPNLGSQGLYNAIGEQIRRPGDAPGYLHGKKLLRWPTGVSPKPPGSVPSAPMN